MVNYNQLKQPVLYTLLSDAEYLRRLAEPIRRSHMYHSLLISVIDTVMNVCKCIDSLEVFNTPGVAQLILATSNLVYDCIVTLTFAYRAKLL